MRRLDESWKDLVAVSVLPAACGLLFLGVKAGQTIFGIDAGEAFQGVCSLIGAGIGFGAVAWQVRKSFEADKALRKAEIARDFRKRLRGLKFEVDMVRAGIQALVTLVGEEAGDRPMTRNDLGPYEGRGFHGHWGKLLDAEDDALQTAFLEMNAQLAYVSHLYAGPQATRENQLTQCRRFIERANTFDREFERAFPKE